MTAKKKTNYISYELDKLTKYIEQLQSYLDSISLEDIQDRLDIRYSQNGNPIVKVIASKEAQVTSYRNNLEKLPSLYEAKNRLKALADNGAEEAVDRARGGKDLPGLFRTKMLGNVITEDKDEEDIEDVKTEEEDFEEDFDNNVWGEDD